jgi:hypothetical protein
MGVLTLFSILFSQTLLASTDGLDQDVSFSTSRIAKQAAQGLSSLRVRGYAQLRYNRLFESNDQLKCAQCDRSLGEDGGFFMRRARVILYGEVHPMVYLYFQPDFASSVDDRGHYTQIRDLYFDVAFNKEKTWRARLGQSKVPFGFENLQSSSNRLALDRNDALNSAVANERDIGAFIYWAPQSKRRLFQKITNVETKGSGDYGILGFGLFNGQTANMSEKNDSQHLVARLTYPFELDSGQVIETSIQGYSGKYHMDNRDWLDERAALSLIYYPQPLGFQMEYNVGRGPEFHPDMGEVLTQSLHGGYAQVMYNLCFAGTDSCATSFLKYQYYDGGKKHEMGRSHRVRELELGVEWRPNNAFELVTMWSQGDRTTSDSQRIFNHQKGHRLRLQAQVNF